MRGTTKITNNNSLYYLNRNFQNFFTAQSKLSAEQQVLRPEDDPLSTTIGVRMLNLMARVEGYNRNIVTGKGSLSLIDGYLDSCKTVADQVKTLTTGAASDTTTSSQRQANAIEMNEIIRQLVLSGNANDGERYVFGGQYTTKPPFTVVNSRYVNYTGNDKLVNIVVDNNTTMPINCAASETFGNMITTIPSRDLNPDVNLSTDRSTRLADLNAGQGVPKGKIMVYYSSYPEGLEVDLSGCDTLEDVKDVIEKKTLEASQALDPRENAWLNGRNLNWRDLQDRYVKVTINPEHNGISLQEFDLGEPLPPPTAAEVRAGIDYTGADGYTVGGGGYGAAYQDAPPAGTGKETVVHNKMDFIYHNPPAAGDSAYYYSPLRVDDYAQNKVAEGLGIKGTAGKYVPGAGNPIPPAVHDPILDGFLHGRDLNPKLSERTLLADLEGYNDSVYTFTNGAKPGKIVVTETTADANNVFNEWNLSGLNKGFNTGANGELYARAVNVGTTANPKIQVEIYSCPISKAKASDLVATGTYDQSHTGGTVILNEANSSGISGTVGVILPDSVKEFSVSLAVDFADTLQASVHVPAFVEETNANGTPKDVFNIASGWSIRGLDKPPAQGYDENHPASTDLDGDVSANFRYDPNTNSLIVELSRPSFANQPATVVATGSLYLGDPPNTPPLGNAVSGRVELSGLPGFEGVKGSVYLEIPSGAAFSPAGSMVGASSACATTVTFRANAATAAGEIVLGGAMELAADQDVDGSFVLTADTVFKKGQIFDVDLVMPGGGILYRNTPLDEDTLIRKGITIDVGPNQLLAGTVLQAGTRINFDDGAGGGLAAGTVIPRGTYYTAGPGFDIEGMGMTVTQPNPATGLPETKGSDTQFAGFDVRATFATIEDFNRAVEQSGIYVTSQVSADGKGLEFRSSLAGAYLTVSEDTDCYEQMGDQYQQLTGLDLTGLVKGVNSDKNGNVYMEVIYYPPNDPPKQNNKVQLVSDSGEIFEVDPGYYVRVYSDPEEMQKSYENRDNTKMVAEGFIPAGEWNPDYLSGVDPATPFVVPTNPPPAVLGFMTDLALEERNGSGVFGHVDLDYYGSKGQTDTVTVTLPNGTTTTKLSTNPWNNDNITVFPGGLRPEGSRHTTIQEWDIWKILPGVTCDYTGTFHGVISRDDSRMSDLDDDPLTPDVSAPLTVALYRDSSHTVMTAKGELDSLTGVVNFYEVDRYGNFARDAAGERIPMGSMTVTANDLLDGQSDNFVLTTGAARNYGQEREENIFSTINDIIDALHANDAGKLHDLLGSVDKDLKRLTEARGEVGARVKRMNLLTDRHNDDILKYNAMLNNRVGMDEEGLQRVMLDYQASMNAYQAAMQVSVPIMQMSLLQYL